MICGIDYGSKLAGTTVCAWFSGPSIEFVQSQPKQDADAFLLSLVLQLKITDIYLDAPLSLPSAYFDQGTDFFYRRCDAKLKAMSPMFLGGLTARAMRLAALWKAKGIKCYEAYPAALWRLIAEQDLGYKKDTAQLDKCLEILQSHFSCALPQVSNWHQFDALLALAIGKRHQGGKAGVYGESNEGLIYV